MKAIHGQVRGHVQGVGFRDSCRAEARRLGVAGWVRNLDSGEVEVWAEGDEAAVEQLVAWCGRGPSGASVEGFEVEAAEPSGCQGFRVR